MKKEGLLDEPEFSNIEKYLESGNRTEVTDKIKKVTETINGRNDGMTVREILVWMNQNTVRLRNLSDSRKFKRTADEILKSKERTGCCDSSTLFTALARSKGIPTMQVITLNKEWGKRIAKGEAADLSGHYFTACYLQDITGKSDWVLIDSDRSVQDVRDVRFYKLNKEDRNIDKNLYAFAYTRDYSDIEFNGMKIDSIKNMIKIQTDACRLCDINDFAWEEERER